MKKIFLLIPLLIFFKSIALANDAEIYNCPFNFVQSYAPVNPTCGLSNGKLSFFISSLPAGTFTLDYKKNGTPAAHNFTKGVGDFMLTISDLGAGVYSEFSITHNSCTLAKPITVTLEEKLELNYTQYVCNTDNIRLNTNLPDGTHTLNYTKDNVTTSGSVSVVSGVLTLEHLLPGVYSNFSVTYNSCTVTNTEVITKAPIITLSITQVNQPTRCGSGDENVIFSTNLPNGNYGLTFYTMNNPYDGIYRNVTVNNGEFTLYALFSTVYNRFVIVYNGCQINLYEAVTITNPTPTLTIGGVTNPSACNKMDGSISFSTTNLSSSVQLSYKKNDEYMEQYTYGTSIIELGPGIYSDFSVSGNGSGCIAVHNTSRTLSSLGGVISLSLKESQNSNCGSSTGKITFNTSLANGKYEISFKNTENEEFTREVEISNGEFTMGGLWPGTYSNFSFGQCTYSGSISVIIGTIPPFLKFKEVLMSPSNTCTSDGMITITSNVPTQYDTRRLYYKLNNEANHRYAQSTYYNPNMFSGLPPGEYSDFMLTQNGCTATHDTTVTLSPSTIYSFSIASTTPPTSCTRPDASITFNTNIPNNNNNYRIYYKVNENLESKIISISSGGTFTISGLPGGVLTDVYLHNNYLSPSCTVHYLGSITIENPATTLSLDYKIDPTSCSSNNGSIVLNSQIINTGNQPITYKHNGIVTSNIATVGYTGRVLLNNLGTGIYSDFKVSTCPTPTTPTVTLSGPAQPVLSSSSFSNPISCSSNDGAIQFNVTNLTGTQTLHYKKNNTVQSTPVNIISGEFSLTGLSPGVYTDFYMISPNGCTSHLNDISVTIICTPCSSTLTLVSTADNYSTGTHIKQANNTTGKITGTNKITGSARVTYEAASVELKPGFSAANGTTFMAKTGGCN